MAEKNEINLSNSEWVIMEYLWDNAPLTVTQIAKAMEGETGWAKSTTKTLISRMEAKGYLSFIEGDRARQYYPAVERSEVVLAETESFLSRLYNGSLGMMVNTLVDKSNLSQREIKELRTILDKMEGVK
ncbi:MAG: BlaI/MecI/CopY family transcriptional regulator [Clostridiaceae bacterium]|nr:BlaI/MecI/CopY family transcriptional regulator [Clostridiaceae bacterium]